jgi:hypothetical protein
MINHGLLRLLSYSGQELTIKDRTPIALSFARIVVGVSSRTHS